MKQYSHSFVICAYQESPYLEECIQSLLSQSDKRSRILIATGTPNDYISTIAQRYGLDVRVNPNGSLGIGEDWNFALSQANTDLVTLAHQDDIYLHNYSMEILKVASLCSHPLILFTDYGERRYKDDIYDNRLLHIKRMLLNPLKNPKRWYKVSTRRHILSLGSAICCPAVTLCMCNLQTPVFGNNLRSNIDWEAWEKISKQKGEFAYIPKPLVLHRIHADSTTSTMIEKHSRKAEDLVVLEKFWPEWIAKVIEKFYQYSEKFNK